MRRVWLLAAAGLGMAAMAAAQEAAPQGQAAGAGQSEAPLTPREAALQQALIAAQRDAAEQRRLAAEAKDQAALLAACREKNERLVGIGNELIAAYEQRFRKSNFGPFQIGRRKLEAELQATGDRVYDNKLDATPRAAASPASESGTAPAPESTPNPG